MGLFNSFADFLKGSVGNNMDNNPEDIKNTKRNLSQAGFFDDEIENEFITRKLDNGIRQFQKNKGLKEDGLLFPGGETERSLFETLTGHSANNVFGDTKSEDDGSIGFGGNVSGTLEAKDETVKVKSSNSFLSKVAIQRFKNKGYSKSERFFRHYVEGSGQPIRLTPEEMNQTPLFREAIQSNRERFEDSIAKGKINGRKHMFKEHILNLKDGESIVLNNKGVPGGGDFWDRDLGKGDARKAGDLDQYNATGNTKFRSHGSIKATRKGNIIEIEGVIDNSFKDLYDFNEKDLLLLPFRKLTTNSHAKPFLVYGTSLEKVTGKLEIRDGNIYNPRFEWRKIKQ
jgi:hypothetical protein